jgi:hypothetical protein
MVLSRHPPGRCISRNDASQSSSVIKNMSFAITNKKKQDKSTHEKVVLSVAHSEARPISRDHPLS